jgi:hypothetical protein
LATVSALLNRSRAADRTGTKEIASADAERAPTYLSRFGPAMRVKVNFDPSAGDV